MINQNIQNAQNKDDYLVNREIRGKKVFYKTNKNKRVENKKKLTIQIRILKKRKFKKYR